MNGIAGMWFDDKHLGSIIVDERSYLVMRRDIRPDGAGRQFLIEGEPASFEIDPSRQDKAVDVIPDFRDPIEIEPEIVVVVFWDSNRGYGWARRKVGGNLYIHRNCIVTEGVESLTAGSRLLCVPAAPQRSTDRGWNATQIEIFQDAESNESEIQTEQEKFYERPEK